MGCLARAETDRLILTSGAIAVRQLTCVACCAMTLKKNHKRPFYNTGAYFNFAEFCRFPEVSFWRRCADGDHL